MSGMTELADRHGVAPAEGRVAVLTRRRAKSRLPGFATTGRTGWPRKQRIAAARRRDVSRRAFLSSGAAGAVALAGAGRHRGEGPRRGADQMGPHGGCGRHRRRRRRTAGRHHGARPRRFRHRRRRELRHRRPRNPERRAGASRRRPRAAAEGRHQGFARPGVRRLDAPRHRRCALQRPRPGAGVCRRERADLQLPGRERRQVHRPPDRPGTRLDGAAHLPDGGMADRKRADRARPRPQRLGPGAPARARGAAEGRRNPAAARDEEHHPGGRADPARFSASR